LVFSILVHLLVVLTPLFGIVRGGGEGVASRNEIISRLVNVRTPGSFEKEGHIDNALKEEMVTSGQFLGNNSEVIPPGNAPREEKSRTPEMGQGDVTGASELHYFSSDQLTVRPYPLTVLENAGLLGPESDDKGERVVLKVWISDSGEVTVMETEFTDMPVRVHEATVAAFRRMRFMPGEIDGKRVGSILRIEMTYKDFHLPIE